VSELVGAAIQAVGELLAWYIEKRYGAAGCFVAFGVVALAALFIFWWASRL
jgi:hypothetical protein